LNKESYPIGHRWYNRAGKPIAQGYMVESLLFNEFHGRWYDELAGEIDALSKRHLLDNFQFGRESDRGQGNERNKSIRLNVSERWGKVERLQGAKSSK
jgi:hypothetical protein